ncbi:MAG: band 7 protein [Deltaproteobacteria bacterium]|nr:band 7 protein [Deltaproteobacteria bacterium]
MAEITRLPFVRHLRVDASSHVLHYRRGRLRRSGRGLSFWFFPMSSSLVEVPVDDRELALVFHGRTSDFQDVSVQGVLSYRLMDPVRVADRVDFTIDPTTGAFRRDPLEKLALLLSNLAQQHALDYVGATPIREVLVEGTSIIRQRVEAALAEDATLSEMGIAVGSVRVSSVKPTPDLERALESPMRERIQQEADEAAFARRALAVEKERAIQENELQNRIELARREEQLIAQRGQNARRQAGEDAEAQRIAATSEAEKTRLSSEAQASSVRVIEGAKVEAERERMIVMRETPVAVLAALAAKELAGNLTSIDHLTLSPEALGPMLTHLVSAGTRALEAGAEPAKPRR